MTQKENLLYRLTDFAVNGFPYPMVHSIDHRMEEIKIFFEKSRKDLKSEIG
jgi:hypothetical protein